MNQPAVSSPLDFASLLLSLSLPTSPRRSPELLVMDRLNVRLLETHQEVSLARDAPQADAAVFVFPDRVVADASPVALRLNEEGRSGIRLLPVISIDEVDSVKEEEEEEEDPVLRQVFAVPISTQVHEEKCNCRACQISAGILPSSMSERGASDARRPFTIADMDVRDMEEDRTDHFLSPIENSSEPTTPNANRSRRPSEKLDYGIDWIEAFKMEPPRQKKSNLADEIDGRLSAMEQEEKERELMADTLNKIDQVSKGKTSDEKRSEVLIDSSITLKDIFGQSAKSDDVVFNTSISLDDVFAGMKTASAHQKKQTADRYYYHDDEDEEEVLPPEVAALYSSRPSTLPQSSSVNIDDVFAALDRRERIAVPRQNLDDFYGDPPSEVFSDSAVSSRQLTESKATDRERGEEEEEEEEEGEGGETRSASSGISHGKATPPREEDWLTSIVEKRRSVEMNLPRGGEQMDDSENEPSPPLDPSQLYPAETSKQTRKESYLHVGELFSGHSSFPREKSIEEEKERPDLDWINRLADTSTEEILDAVFACSAVGGEKGKKCGCQACDPDRNIYLEREAATTSEERKRSLHLVNPVEITLEEVFEGKKKAAGQEMTPIQSTKGQAGEKAVDILPPVEIDLEEVFSTPVHSPSSWGIDSEKWKPRVILKEVKQSVAPQSRKRSAGHEAPLAPSDIDLTEVFEGSHRLPSTPHSTPVTDVDVDLIFAPSSSSSSSTTMSRVNLEKFQPKSLEREHKQPLPATPSRSVRVVDPVDMEEVFSPSKTTKEIGIVSTSTFPVLLRDDEMADKEYHITNIAEEIVSEAIDEALRSSKLEKTTDDQGMIFTSSFPVFLVDKKSDTLEAETVKFGLTSASASPEPSSVDLDQVFSGVSTEHKPRIDLSKYEQRSLERKKQPTPTPVLITNSSVPVIVADPLDMDQVFNPSSTLKKESPPAVVAEMVVQDALEDAMRTPKLDKSDIDLNQVFTSSSSAPRVDLSKFEERTLERRRDTPRPVMTAPSTRPVVIADPLDMNLVFVPAITEKKESMKETIESLKEEEEHFSPRSSPQPSYSIPLDTVSSSIAEVIVAEAMDEALRSPALKESSSSAFAFSFTKEERVDSFAQIDSDSSLDTVTEHVVYPRTITHVRSSAPDLAPRRDDVTDDVLMKTVEEEEEEDDEEDEETPLPVFARSRNPAYGLSSDRPRVTQSEDVPVHISDPISVVTDLSPSPSVKKIISHEPSNERSLPISSIDLDDVFASPQSPSSSTTSRIDLDKFVARTLERGETRARSAAPPPETRETTRHSELPPSAISVDDIFTPQQPVTAPSDAPTKPPRRPQQSESGVTDPMDDPAAEVDLDSVFATSFGSEGKGQLRFASGTVDRTLTAEFNDRKEAAASTISTLPSSDVDVFTPVPVAPPRRSPRPSDAPLDETPAPPPRQKLVTSSSFPILVAESPSATDDAPTPPARQRGGRLSPAGIVIVDEPPPHPATPPPSLSTTPVPPTRSHRRTDSVSLPRSRTASYSRVSESIAEGAEESALTVDATFTAAASDAARPSVTVTERGNEATVDILLPPRAPPRMNFPPPPPVVEIEYDMGMTSSTTEEEVKEARLMASPDFPPLSVVTAPVEIDMNAVFDRKILTPSRFDTDRWQPRTLEREKKRTIEEVVEKRPKSELPESAVDIDEIFSGRLTTTNVEYATSPPRLTLKKTEEKKENWEDDLSKEIDEYERRRNRLGQETDGSIRSTISRASSIPFSSTPEGTWRRNESLRSAQEPVVALIEKEKRRKASSSSEKSGKSAKRKGSRGSWKVEHLLEPQPDGLIETSEQSGSGPKVEAREAKRNGKVWRVDRVQKTASASIEDSEDEKGVKIQVHSIPAPLSVSMDSIDDIERSIDDAFDEALSPRGRNIEIRRIPSSSVVRAEVHRHDESETYPHPEYSTQTLEGRSVYRSVTSLPSTSETTKIVFPLTSPMEEQRYVTSASIRLEKTLPTPDTTMERKRERGSYREEEVDPYLKWIPSSVPVERVTMRKRSRSEGPLGLFEDVIMDGKDSSDARNYRMSWHPSSIRTDLEDRGYRGIEEKIHGSLTTTVRVAGYSSPKSGRSREARERRKKIIRKSRHSVSSSTSNGESTSTKPDEEEMLEVEVRKRHIVLRGSYNLVVSKDEPLGLLLLSLSDGQPIVPAALDFSVLPKLRRLLRECMTRRARSVSMLSSRGASLLEISDPSFENIKTVSSDLFHPINNPRGKVNLCTAENRVCEEEVSKKLEEIRFHPDSHRWMLRYAGSGGIKETKLALVSHFSSFYSFSIDEEEALLLPSCTAAYDVLSHLCCDPQDVILTPSPYYARIRNDCSERNECRVEPVELDMDKPELFVSDFEREFATWASKGERVRAIVLVNPHNPLGNIFSRHQMMSVCEWAMSNDLFIIVDEILAGTIYDGRNIAEFPSILGLKKELSKPEQLVWMGSLSKDLGLPGIKTALIVSSSPAIREAVRRMENLGSVPAPSQLIVNQLLADKVWLSSTLSSVRRRLQSHARFVVQSLEDIDVPCVIPKGGICLMADFSKLMSSVSSEEENSLHRRFIEHGVVLTKGESTVAPIPGWFRVSFGVPKEELELGLRRIYSTIARDATLKRTVNYGEATNGAKKEWLVSEVRSTSPGTTVESA